MSQPPFCLHLFGPGPVSVWVYDGTLKLEYQAVTLSKYRVEQHDDLKGIKSVSNPRVTETVFRSPQLTLFDLGPGEFVVLENAALCAQIAQTSSSKSASAGFV